MRESIAYAEVLIAPISGAKCSPLSPPDRAALAGLSDSGRTGRIIARR